MSRFLFYMGHPAHFHNFKYVIEGLLAQGHAVLVVARGKDVLFDLIDTQPWKVVKLPERKPGGKLAMAWSILKREFTMLRIAQSFKPNMMAGTDLVITHIGKLLKIPTVVVNEDDSRAVPLMAKWAFPFASAILAPHCCDQSPANNKKIGYPGYHELAYLHPDVFTPDRGSLPKAVQGMSRYFILRFASLHAHHDKGRKGISDSLALKLIDIMAPYGQVIITSERPLSAPLEPYRMAFHPSEIHQVLAFASLYIGDSQTMAAEAAVLGIPAIRFNDFVGELSYLEELEHTHRLTKGIKTADPALLEETVRAWVADEQIADRWSESRAIMLANTISVTPFWIEIFEKTARA